MKIVSNDLNLTRILAAVKMILPNDCNSSTKNIRSLTDKREVKMGLCDVSKAVDTIQSDTLYTIIVE